MGSKKRIIKQIAFFSVSLIVLLGLLEWYLRFAIPGWHTTTMPQQMIDQHTRIGFRYDRDLMWYWKELPSSNEVLNEYGFRRKKEMTQQKPPHVKRVIVFGDSQTYGGGVDYNETFSYYAEQHLGENWEVLNAGISGYRSLQIFRLMRQKMMEFQPDIFVVNCMLYDSPAEDGQLHQEIHTQDKKMQIREWLWNSRLNYVFQLSMRKMGFGVWEDLPWPIHLHKVREMDPQRGTRDLGNHQQISDWSRQRGVQTIFMEYASRDIKENTLRCQSTANKLPKPVFPTCQMLQQSDYNLKDIFIDSNHLTPQGAEIIGTALGVFLEENG